MKKKFTLIIAGTAILALGLCSAFIPGTKETKTAEKATENKSGLVKGIDGNCTFNGKKLYGKIQVVTSFPDIKVQKVTSFPDLKVQEVTSFPDACGKWQFVTSFPDLKVQFVESFPDIKVQFVTSFPGKP
jgi:hypothetical protein